MFLITSLKSLPFTFAEWFASHLPGFLSTLGSEVLRLGVSNLLVAPPLVVEDVHLEADGLHLTPAAGRFFLETLSKAISAELTALADVTLVDATGTEDGEVSESEVEELPESDAESDRLGSILKIVKSNSKVLSAVKPLKESVVSLVQRSDAFETQVRVRRQRDNYVFARIKEETDADLNRSREDRVVVSGLARSSSGLLTHQEKKEYYKSVITGLIGISCPDSIPKPLVTDILVNLRREQVNPIVEAKFDSLAGAFAFRRAAAALAKAKSPQFAALFFSNSVTQATRVRIEIMRAIAKKLTTASETAYVQGFISKPALHYVVKEGMPSHCAGTGRSYNFVDSVARFGDLLMPLDLAPAYKRAGDTFKGSMEHYFIVLKEDDAQNVRGANQFPLGRRGARGARGAVRGFARGRFAASSGRKRAPDSPADAFGPAKRRSDSVSGQEASGASPMLE